ncbi:inosine-5'-monophosphate dehydrogenase [Kordia sp. SMS9]|uniref:CBS domain-containing protein n=1 Tax=Kordia sp. SMS9 TaxID=2282170 RepID=UPI000E0DF003|nr:CBS domain-containing protein [Kordia sp. SMS9]AXG68561.1 inosine-5'-monophosphate dehydrogenase [Kordia sp. SMS9]
MGSQLVKPIDSDELQKEFIQQLLYDIEALATMIETNDFEQGIQRIGAEQEVCIVDSFYRPSFNALEILDEINDPHFTTELGLFNIEANLDPIVLKDNCFSQLEKDLTYLLEKAQKAAKTIKDNKIILAGILPTFKRSDLVFENMTPHKRYKTLNDILKDIKGNDFKLQIRGVDELILRHESILFEACNTSFQVHLQIGLDEIIDKYNWSQAIAGPVLATMTNAPMLLGKELWSETRIALFQQSIDLRNTSHLLREQKPRVSFGTDWIKNSILDVFTDDITRYKALVTTDFEGNSVDDLAKGIKPKLKALNLHNGTLYKWNRVCYGVAKNVAHLRIENRYIPAGPSIKDEIANALFWVGVMQGMPDDCKNIWERMHFKDARGNFIKAARTGLDSYFNWFGEGISAKKLVLEVLIPMAKEGLKKSNVSDTDSDYYLGIIEDRVHKNTNGSKWQVRSARKLNKIVSAEETNILLTHHLYQNQLENRPVHEWELATVSSDAQKHSQNKMYKVMTKEVYVVNENDLVGLIEKIMQWKNIHHIPVVDEDNKIVGIISATNLNANSHKDMFVKEIMSTNIIVGTPEMTIEKAEKLMLDHEVACLPILDNDYLVGIFTKNDLKKIKSNY